MQTDYSFLHPTVEAIVSITTSVSKEERGIVYEIKQLRRMQPTSSQVLDTILTETKAIELNLLRQVTNLALEFSSRADGVFIPICDFESTQEIQAAIYEFRRKWQNIWQKCAEQSQIGENIRKLLSQKN